jgi:hypothetical protein
MCVYVCVCCVCVCVCVCVYAYTHTHTHAQRAVGAKLDMGNLCEYLAGERFGDRVFKVRERERGGRGMLGVGKG